MKRFLWGCGIALICAVSSVSAQISDDDKAKRAQNFEHHEPPPPLSEEKTPNGGRMLNWHQKGIVAGSYVVMFRVSTAILSQSKQKKADFQPNLLPITKETTIALARAFAQKYGGKITNIYKSL